MSYSLDIERTPSPVGVDDASDWFDQPWGNSLFPDQNTEINAGHFVARELGFGDDREAFLEWSTSDAVRPYFDEFVRNCLERQPTADRNAQSIRNDVQQHIFRVTLWGDPTGIRATEPPETRFQWPIATHIARFVIQVHDRARVYRDDGYVADVLGGYWPDFEVHLQHMPRLTNVVMNLLIFLAALWRRDNVPGSEQSSRGSSAEPGTTAGHVSDFVSARRPGRPGRAPRPTLDGHNTVGFSLF